MMQVQEIEIKAFDYELPDEKIAKYPLEERDLSKLLVVANDELEDRRFKELPNYIKPGDLMVFNNTKVIHARMQFRKETGARIEIFCLEPLAPLDYNLIFQAKGACEWKCIVGNAKKWKAGRLEYVLPDLGFSIFAALTGKMDDGSYRIRFEWDSEVYTYGELLEIIGEIPIPPYLNRDSEVVDSERYQTVYSKQKGSVAAPTAGLHFTPAIFERLKEKEVGILELTLHVGAGTFKPVKSTQIGGHDMHTEHFFVSVDSLRVLQQKIGRIIPVGTTSLRMIESAYWLGVLVSEKRDLKPEDLLVSQWMPYEDRVALSAEEALDALIAYLERNNLSFTEARTQIMIVPGYEFRFIKALVTNFHQPQSTLLLLISAIVGDKWRSVYAYALEHEYRFLSYGDSSILFLNS